MDDSRDQGHSETSQASRPASGGGGIQLLKWSALCSVCVAAALSISYLLAISTPSEEPEEVAQAGSTISEESVIDLVSKAVPQEANIRLPTQALPAGKEQLEAEARFVANTLQQSYPDRAEALHVAAMMHAQFRESSEAEGLWKRCIQLSPKDPRYSINFAAIAMERGDSEAAADTLKKAYDAGVSSLDLLHHLGVALNKVGKSEEAEAVAEKGIAEAPEMPSLWMVLGQAQLKQRKLSEAETSLKKAIDLGVQSSSVYSSLASALAQQDEEEEAKKYRDLVEEANGEETIDAQRRFQVQSTAEARQATIAILIEAASVQMMMENSLEAELLLLRALALDPTNLVGYQLLGQLYQDAGLAAEERLVRQRLVDLDPFQLNHHFNLARAAQDSGDKSAALAALKYAVTIQPGAAEPFLALAQFQLDDGNVSQARWYAQEALRRRPSATGFRLLSMICEKMGDEANAVAALSEAWKLESQSPLP